MAHNARVNEEGGGRRHPKIHRVEPGGMGRGRGFRV